ncbi:hypothetical protein OH76DRAFT_1008251 [Lentinus brumalis]|uniref:Uncharacterized protein n=1 Tax=Lentinus brumalis TaxID=2498619 RepID=A0A371CY85_9APHY|nr:hypothetical protein OH76DRAFT_1008251 [Polyporus brumalis]
MTRTPSRGRRFARSARVEARDGSVPRTFRTQGAAVTHPVCASETTYDLLASPARNYSTYRRSQYFLHPVRECPLSVLGGKTSRRSTELRRRNVLRPLPPDFGTIFGGLSSPHVFPSSSRDIRPPSSISGNWDRLVHVRSVEDGALRGRTSQKQGMGRMARYGHSAFALSGYV